MAKRPANAAPKAAPKAPSAPREGPPALAPRAAGLETPASIPLGAIIGHERPLAILRDALRADRVHHAWIFHGPAGVGKRTCALAFAGVALDPTTAPTLSGELAPDPDSPTQHLVRAGAHPDVHVIRKELAAFHEDARVRERKQTTIPLDVVRAFLLEPGGLAATVRTEAPVAKVFIVDEAELLAGPAQNAVLKFLEEPPPRTLVILVTESEERLLPTIRSRCQRVFFAPLTDEDMRRFIRERGIAIQPDDAPWLLAFADGAPGVLSVALEHDLVSWKRRLEPLLANADRGVYRVELGALMAQLADEWAEAWVKARPAASKEAANKAGADWVLRVVASHLRAGLRGTNPAPASWRRIELLREAEREIDANVNLAFVFEKLAAELCAAATPAR